MAPKDEKPLTVLAKVYGHPINWSDSVDCPIFTMFPESKIGLIPSFLKGNAKKSECDSHKKLANYQRARFRR